MISWNQYLNLMIRWAFKKTERTYPQIIPDAFTFSPVSLGDVQKEIINPNVKKSSSVKSIPAIIL